MKETVKKDRFDYPDGTYTIKEVYDKSSAITTYGNNDKVLSIKWYSDKNFKNLCATEKREYNNEFTEYKSELVYSEPFYDKYYSVRTIEKSGKEKQVFYYTDAKFTLLAKEYI